MAMASAQGFSVLNGLKRNWDPTHHDMAPIDLNTAHTGAAQLHDKMRSGLGLPPTAALGPRGYPAPSQEQLPYRTATFGPAPPAMPSAPMVPRYGYDSRDGRVRIVVTQLFEGYKLGLAMKGLEVFAITNASASIYGWCVGDQVVSVNGQSVYTQDEFAQAHAFAVDTYQATRSPVVYEVLRAVGRRVDERAQPTRKKKDVCCGGDDDPEESDDFVRRHRQVYSPLDLQAPPAWAPPAQLAADPYDRYGAGYSPGRVQLDSDFWSKRRW